MSLSTEELVEYLRVNPDFFERNADVFANMAVPNPHGGRAISLVERQLLAVKDKVKQMEMKMAQMLRAGQENTLIVEKFSSWTRLLVAARLPAELPWLVESGIARHFNVPQVALRLWDFDDAFGGLPCAQPVPVDVITFANGMMAPYCGPNSGFTAAGWLSGDAASIALLPLRVGAAPQAFGMLVLGSADPQRFASHMGTEMLARIAEVASAALSRLLPDEHAAGVEPA
jgi:uncharacterized protein YigA (DUF484 family)